MDENQDLQNPKVLNQELLARILEEESGEIKSASAAGTKMIRRKIREDGFLRNILPPEGVTNADLDRVPDHDRPVIIEDMEPLSKGAVSIPFGASADTQFFYGSKYTVEFNPITTREFTKDINELRTYRMDLRQVITDNALKDIQTEEDGQFISLIDFIVGSTPNLWKGTDANVGKAGVNQNWYLPGGLTRDNYVEMLKVLENQELNNGIFLMNRSTAKDFLKLTRDKIGGDLAQDLFKGGLKALTSTEIFGTKHVFTIKRAMVPDNVVYLFTEPGYLGKFYTLTDVTMYVKKEKDFLKFSARETIGVTIANMAGVAKFSFEAPPE